jgi:hypothetical protein
MNLIKKVDNLKVLLPGTRATNDKESAAEKYIRTAGLEELMRVNDSGKI